MYLQSVALLAVAAIIRSVVGQTILFSGSEDSTIKAWNANTGMLLRTMSGHKSAVNSIVVFPNGTLLFSGSDDATIILWDVATGAPLSTLSGHTNRVLELAMSSDGSLLFSCSSDMTIKTWNVSTLTLKRSKSIATVPLSIAVTPNGNRLVAGNTDHTVVVWDVGSGDPLFTMTGHNLAVLSVVVPSDDTAYSGASDGNVMKWNITSGTRVATLPGSTDVTRVLFEDGTIFSADRTPSVVVWSASNYSKLRTFSMPATPFSLSGSPVNGELFVGLNEGTILALDKVSGAVRYRLQNHTDVVWTLVLWRALEPTAAPTTTTAPPTTTAPVPVELIAAVLRISSSNVNLSVFGPNSTNATLAQEVQEAVRSDLSNALHVNRSWILIGASSVPLNAAISAASRVYSAATSVFSAIEFPYTVTVPADDVRLYTEKEFVNLQSQLVGDVAQINASSLIAFTAVVRAATNVTDLGITASSSTTDVPPLDGGGSTTSALSGGAVAGIVIGVLAAVCIVVGAVVFAYCRLKRK